MLNTQIGIDEVTHRVFLLYQRQRTLEGGEYPYPIQKDVKVWFRAARIIESRKLDPTKFVAAQFKGVKAPVRRSLSPKEFCPSELVSMRRYNMVNPEDEDPIHYENEQQQLGIMITRLDRMRKDLVPRTYQDEEALLMNPVYSFTGWFRILFTPKLTARMKKSFLEEARTEFAANRALQEFLTAKRGEYGYDLERLR